MPTYLWHDSAASRITLFCIGDTFHKYMFVYNCVQTKLLLLKEIFVYLWGKKVCSLSTGGIKILFMEADEMIQHLKVCTALAEDLSTQV